MNYSVVKVTTDHKPSTASILVIYTGGTIGMARGENGALVPFDFREIIKNAPYVSRLNLNITFVTFHHPLDSSDISIGHWQNLGSIIHEYYQGFDGFVILHGTDTMAYSASAMSYILGDLNKPVIFTGAQLPMGNLRSDARENLVTSLEIASAKENGKAVVPEVCIFFDDRLLRGNRARKFQSDRFRAFESKNYPSLAEAGITIDYFRENIRPHPKGEILHYSDRFDDRVIVLKLFPGINKDTLTSILSIPDLKGIVLETYGSGNAPTAPWFLDLLKKVIDRNIVILNVTQCIGGYVDQGKYETSGNLKKIGVISGRDLTTEAAVTKMMFLFGKHGSAAKVKKEIAMPICGEMALSE